MRRTFLSSSALLALSIATGLAYAQGTPAERRELREEGGAPRAAQERVRTERPARESGAERPTGASERPSAEHEERRSSERAEERRQTRPQPERSTEREGQQPSRPATSDQRRPTEHSGAASERQGSSERSGGEHSGAGRAGSRTGESGSSATERRSSPAQTSPTQGTGQRNETAQPSQTAPTTPTAAPATTTPPGQTGSGSAAVTAPTPGTTPRDAQRPASSDTRIELTPERRQRIGEIITRDRGDRQRVDFTITVGQTVPSYVRRHPLPTEIVEFAPQYRGYDYFVVEDEMVIVEPGTNRIVTTVSRNGDFAGPSSSGSSASFSAPPSAGAQGSSGDLCRIEDASHGGGTGNSGLAVAVRNQDGRSTDMIALPQGRITVTVDQSGACTIKVER